MKRLALIILCFSIVSFEGLSQESSWRYFITPNVNLYIPRNSDKQVYPILGYNKNAKPKVLIGGFGVGVLAMKSLKQNVSLRAQANISKHAYWDEAFELRDANNTPLGDFIFGSSDFAVGLTGQIHYHMTERISIGTGIGVQMFTTTLSRLPELEGGTLSGEGIGISRYYKPFLPMIPLELSLATERRVYNIRYEHGLSNRYKRALAEFKNESFGLLYFEMGFKIR